MQPFDALCMRAIIHEAKPLLLKSKVEKIQQLSRDEIVISLRSSRETIHLTLSAQASFGHLCLSENPLAPSSKQIPQFSQLLKKHLQFATIIDIAQIDKDRIVDITFISFDELGNKSTKILTAEIMGRNSNLILWEKDSSKIIAVSHNVTNEMSRYRELLPGINYCRPPKQNKINIFDLDKNQFERDFEELQDYWQKFSNAKEQKNTTDFTNSQNSEILNGQLSHFEQDYEAWLTSKYSGIGRHLSQELIDTSAINKTSNSKKLFSLHPPQNFDKDLIWQKIEILQKAEKFVPKLASDLSKFSILSWSTDTIENLHDWKYFESVNELVDSYFRALYLRSEIQQLKERIKSELKSEKEKLTSRLELAKKVLTQNENPERLKQFGDLILANIAKIRPGQEILECINLYNTDLEVQSNSAATISIELNKNVSATQNAQIFYKNYAKARIRANSANTSCLEINAKLNNLENYNKRLEQAQSMTELQTLKEIILDRNKKIESNKSSQQDNPKKNNKTKLKNKLLNIKSSDGFTIIVGRNKQENDLLISKFTQAHDIWLHALGVEGAHVVIKLPEKRDPPMSTIKEAAQLAARFSKIGLGGKVQVSYTYGKYVKKISAEKPGLVRYENEKNIEIDTSTPIPDALRKLFT